MKLGRLFNFIMLYNNLGLDLIYDLYCLDKYFISKRSADNLNIGVGDKAITLKIPNYMYKYKDSDGKYITYNDMSVSELEEAIKHKLVTREAFIKNYKKLDVYEVEYDVLSKLELGIDFVKLGNALDTSTMEETVYEITKHVNEENMEIVKSIVLRRFEDESLQGINSNNLDDILYDLLISYNYADRICKRSNIIDFGTELKMDKLEQMITDLEAEDLRNLIN